LYERADAKRKQFKGEKDLLDVQLEAHPPIEPAQIEELDNCVLSASAELQKANSEVERLREVESKAKEWAKLQEYLDRARKDWQPAVSHLADADAIEKDLARLTSLKLVVPRAEAIIKLGSEIQDVQKKIDGHQAQLDRLGGQIADAEEAVARAVA